MKNRQNTRRNRKNTRRNRKNRQNTRKNRQNTRKNRQNMRKRMNTRRNNMMYGGMRELTPMELTDVSMNGPSKQSIAQGTDFFGYHAKQHGGMAPVGTTGVLDDSLRTYARLAPLDKSFTEIVGMRDQAGGKRKGRKGKKGRKSTRKMRGGAMPALNPMETSAPGTLLPPALERAALSTMSPEWKLAENPASFAPKL